ncbi:HFL268Wp [Eremothecium sinecaudum]|uniref:HFL268Wp n=1 Tax=Eremothecium sinecaudum TaxID=45286 RepID=A0A120K2H8_9SACH|nr:HFL268Wp [Eremothecium sinecaudum]AMD21588.1 HFL268Wp [Eremothecium sinecaudum]
MGVLSISGKLLTALLLAGNAFLLLLIVLSGSIEHRPFSKLYWVEADTSGIPNAPDQTRWTYWGRCSKENDRNANCLSSPAYPMSPQDNFNTRNDIPTDFVENRDSYYYLSRFAFCAFLVAFAFLGIAAIFHVFSWCSYSFAKVVFTLVLLGSLFDLGAVACQTAVSVMTRDRFNGGNRQASLGAALFGIAWTSALCSLLTFFGTGTSFISRAWASHKEYVEMQHYKEQALRYQQEQQQHQHNASVAPPPPATPYGAQTDLYDSVHELESGKAYPEGTVVTHGQPPVSQQRHESGVKFFKVRRNKKVGDDDTSV